MTSYINWDGKQASIVDAPDLDALFVIDMGYPKHMDELRYGTYNPAGVWSHISFKDFPAEFKVSMLLLGVSP